MKTFAVVLSRVYRDGRGVTVDFVVAKSKKAATKAVATWADDIVLAVEVLTRAKYDALKDGLDEAEEWCSQIYFAEGPEPIGCPKMRVIRESARAAAGIISHLLWQIKNLRWRIGEEPPIVDK